VSQNPPHDIPTPLLHHVELSELQAHPGGAPVLPQRLNLFAGVKAKVSVVAGQATATVGELLSLKEGGLLQLDREVDALFDVVLDGQVLARGRLVAVGEHFGVRICQVCEPATP